MYIIDRYLLRKFLHTFLICFSSLIGLYVVCDLVTNLDEFLRCGRNAGGVLPFILRYYGFKTIWLFENTCGMLLLVSAMFTVSWIQKNNEMVALMAAGVSRIRVLTPIVAAVAAISVLGVVNREFIMPRYRTELSRRPQDPAGDKPQRVEYRYDFKTNVFLNGQHTYADRNRIERPEFSLPPALREYGKQLVADNAYYQPAGKNHPSGYLLDGMQEPKNLDTRPSLKLNGEPVVITPRDAPDWLKPNQCFLVSDVAFDYLTAGGNVQQLSSTLELIRGLHNPSLDYRADARVEVHSRFLRPILDMTLLFLGLPLVVARESRNVFIAMGMCMGVTTAFSAVVIGAQYLGAASLLSPPLAAWMPLLIFAPVATLLVEHLRQ